MPKLKLEDVERNQLRIEQAALRLFTRQGFHGTPVREIADEASISLGNLYNYYANKEEIFASLVKRYGERMAILQRRVLTPLLGEMNERDLLRLARAVREIVYRNPDYWKLMYIDVVEFHNRHFAHSFRDLGRNLAAVTGQQPRLAARKRNGVDPSFAFIAIYLQFFTYFLVEKLFGGKQHLGLPEEQAIAQLIKIYSAGMDGHGTGKNGARRKRI